MLRSRLKIPLHLFISVPFVLQVLGIVGLVGYFSYRSGEKSVQELLDRLAIGLTDNVETHLIQYLDQAQAVNQLNLKAIKSGTIDLQDFEKLGRYFYYQVKQFKFDYINFCGVDKRFIGAGYGLSSSNIDIAEISPKNPNLINAYKVNEIGEREQLIIRIANSNVQHKPWYTEAIETTKPIWSSIYTWGDLPSQISISASQSVYDDQGELLGVLGIDLKLDAISRFLKEISQSHDVSIFIVERSGNLVASSSDFPSAPVVEGTATRIAAIASGDPTVRQVTALLNDRFGSLNNIEEPLLLRPRFDDSTILSHPFVKVTPFKDDYGLNWLIVTVISEDQFMAKIYANGRQTLLFCGLALVTSLIFGGWTARRLSYALVQLQKRMQALAESDFQTTMSRSSIREIDQLSSSFSTMATALQAAQHLQENYQNTLQAEVAQKTIELTEAQAIAQVGSWDFDVTTGKTKWSAELYRIYEATEQCPTETPHLTIQKIYEADQAKYQQEIIDCVAAGQPFDCDLRIITQKGNLRYIQAKGRPFFNDRGEILGYRGTVADISDRKFIELALKASELQLQEISQSSPVHIYIFVRRVDGSFYFEHLSQAIEPLLEISPEAVHQDAQIVLDRIHPADRPGYDAAVFQSMNSLEPFHYEWRVINPSGKIKWLQGDSRPVLRDNGEVAWHGVVQDISDRKQLEIALADSQKQLSEVLDTAIVGIIRLRFYGDAHLEYDYISPHCEKIFGFAVADLISNPGLWQSRIHPEDWEKTVLPVMKGVLQEQDLVCSRTMEYRLYRSNGDIVWILANCFCQWNKIGNYWNITVVDTDISDRKKLELEVQSSEAKLQRILNSASAIITHLWVYPNQDWEIDYVSAGAEEISGYSQTELKTPNLWPNCIVPEDWDAIKEQAFEDIVMERSNTYEYRFLRKDNQICWIAQTNHSHWDETRKAWSVTIITMDICDRKKAEEKLQTSEATLAEAQRIAHIGNWSFDLETQKIDWSEELFRMFGLDPSTPPPSYSEYLDLIDPPDRLALQEKIKLAITEGKPYLIDYKALLPDGSVRFHEGRGEVQRDHQGNIIGLKGTGLDITARKVVELELMQRTQEIDRFFSVALDLLCFATPEGYFLRLNPQWEKTLGYPLDELQGSRFLDYVHPDDLSNTLKAVEHLTEEGILPTFVNRYRCQTGNYCWLEWRSVMVGNIIYAAARDISQQKQTQDQLQQAKEQAEALTRAKGEFLANMSHEIRTPLSSVISIAGLLNTEDLKPEQQDLVATLSYSSNTLLRILNDILDFSKIESGGLSLEKQPFSIAEEIASILKLFEASAQEKRLVLKSSIPLHFPTTVLGDAARLRQILLNLIGNAIKFTETGSIWVIVRERSLQKATPIDRYELLFSIQDTGIGIQSEQLEKIFAPFSQGDSSISRQYGGTGLGLVISQRLVELMGGSLWVESGGSIAGSPPADWQPSIDSVNVPGATFYFTIVLESDRQSDLVQSSGAHSSPIDPQLAERHPLTILLADDNTINRKVIQFSFKRLGYVIDTVENGRKALEAVQQKNYDLVLMDMQMPEMDGLTATRLIRSAPIKQPWITALTANVLPQDRQACFDAGMNGYETKPLKVERIQEICKDLNPSSPPSTCPDSI
ncbi:MAG: PAS domain-containing protein [Prochlorotrichaceae cyanobacterium]